MALTWRRFLDLDAATSGETRWGPEALFVPGYVFGGTPGASTVNCLWSLDSAGDVARLTDGPRTYGKTRGAFVAAEETAGDGGDDYLLAIGGIVRDNLGAIDASLSRETLTYWIDADVWEIGRLGSLPLPASGSAYLDLAAGFRMSGTMVARSAGLLEHDDLWVVGMNNDAGVPRFLHMATDSSSWVELAQPFNGEDVVFGTRPAMYADFNLGELIWVVFLNVANTPRVEAWVYDVSSGTTGTWSLVGYGPQDTFDVGQWFLTGHVRLWGIDASAAFSTDGWIGDPQGWIDFDQPLPLASMTSVGPLWGAAGGLPGGYSALYEADDGDGSWLWEMAEAPISGSRQFADAADGNPAHIFVHREGGSASIPLSDFRAREKANGGLIGATARAAEDDVNAHADVIRQDAILRSVERETGRVIFQGVSKPPGHTAGVVDISVDGVGTHFGNKEAEVFLAASDDYSLWEAIRGDDSALAPGEAIGDYSVINIGLGFLALGTYYYVVTFVTADGETNPGPVMSATVDASEELANVRLKEIPTGPPAVTSRKIYRNDPGMPAEEFRLLTTIADNTTEEYTDNTGDVSGNTLTTHPHVAEGITCTPHEDHLQIDVAPGAYVYADQVAGFTWHVRRSDAQRLRALFEQSRAASNWEIRIHASENRQGPWTLEETVDLSASHSKLVGDPPLEFTEEDADAVRIVLKRKTDGSDAAGLSITIRRLRVYGEAEDDDYSTSDLVRSVCSRLGISDGMVMSTGVPCLPQLFRNVPYSAILDMATLLTGPWRWLFLVQEDAVVCDFAPYKRRRWGLVAPADTLPLPQYSRVVVEDPEGRELAEAVANPNPLGYRKTLRIALPFRIDRDVAQVLAEMAVEDAVAVAWTGSTQVTEVLNENGQLVPHTRVRGGDQVLEPTLGVYLNVDSLERQHHLSRLEFPDRWSRVDRFVARLERRRAKA